MIDVEHVTKDYGHYRAVDDISFSVEKGEILGFLGPNGAGKTTVMRILTCFFPPTLGKVTVAGYDCFEDSLSVRKKIGYLPERVPLYEDMTACDYLSFAAGVKGVPANEIKGSVARVIDEFGLEEVPDRMIGALSRGYRQRVGLAQSVINDPEVLILDEPTVGLDPMQIKEVRRLIKEMAGRRTVILSTHILPEVSLLCGRVIIINKGKLVAMDRPENLISRNTARMFLRINGSPSDIERELTQLDSTISVARESASSEDSNGFMVEFDDEKGVRQSLHSIIARNNWELVEMRPVDTSLEEIFVDLVTKEEA